VVRKTGKTVTSAVYPVAASSISATTSGTPTVAAFATASNPAPTTMPEISGFTTIRRAIRRGSNSRLAAGVDHRRRPQHEHDVRLGDKFRRLIHRGYPLPEPDDVRPELAPVGTAIAEVDVAVAKVHHERRSLSLRALLISPWTWSTFFPC